ncbi:hypothetical protein [Brachybacterium huguangmaarense]
MSAPAAGVVAPGTPWPGRVAADAVAPVLPERRVAILRRIIAAFVVIDVLAISNDVLAHAHTPEFYRPMMLARLLHLPAVTTPIAATLLAVIVVAGILGALGRAARATGWALAVAFWIWMAYSQGYGYVSHDHLALMVAVAVLPMAGPCRTDLGAASRFAGWSLRAIQLAVVATYFLSVVSKTVISGSPITWANSAVFAFAFIRRGAPWVRWMLDHPWLFVPAQWTLLALETLSPLALVLRGRALSVLIGIFAAFHLATFVALGIHFLPTVVCWAAFLPLETMGRGRRARD